MRLLPRMTGHIPRSPSNGMTKPQEKKSYTSVVPANPPLQRRRNGFGDRDVLFGLAPPENCAVLFVFLEGPVIGSKESHATQERGMEWESCNWCWTCRSLSDESRLMAGLFGCFANFDSALRSWQSGAQISTAYWTVDHERLFAG